MDANGHEKIVAAIEPHVLEAPIVWPVPQEGEKEAFVTVVYGESPHIVLNALHNAGLAYRQPSRQMTPNNDPNLEVLGITSETITFIDRNAL